MARCEASGLAGQLFLAFLGLWDVREVTVKLNAS